MGFVAERAIAEQAIACYEANETDDPVFPAVAQRIRLAREGLGLTQDEVAARWGQQPSMYWDLELFDGEAFTVISLHELQRLASVLQTSVNLLLFGEEPQRPLPIAIHADAVARLEARMAQEGLSAEQLSDRIGWDVAPLFADPVALGDLPIVGVWSVCRAVDVDWVAVLNTYRE